MKKILSYFVGFVSQLSFLPPKIVDFLMWPIATRLLGKEYVQKVDLKDGFSMYGSMEDILSRKILFLGPFHKNIWEPSTSILLEKLSKDSKEIVIAGSHIGYLVLKSALATKGRVHAFEPIQSLFKYSQNNFALNPSFRNRIILTNSALGDSRGELKLYSEDIRSSAFAYSGGHVSHQNIITAPLTTLDIYKSEKNLEKIDLILLDVEGFEWNVLKGATEILKNNPDLILEISPRVLNHTELTSADFINKITNLGYNIFFIDDYSKDFCLVEYSIEQEKIFFTRDYVNIYATKK